MSQFRLARISLLLAAIGLNAAPALLTSAHAQAKPAAPAAAEAQKDTVRPEMFKLIDPAVFKEMMAAKKFPELNERIVAAEAMPNRTPYEDYILNRMKLALGSASANDAMAMSALETVINSGRLPANEQADFVQALGNYHYNAKNYPKAIELMKRYQKESATPEKVRSALVRAYYLSGDFANAKAELLPIIADAEKAGKAPEPEDLRLLGSSAAKLKDDPTYIMAMEKLVTYHPSDDYWTDLLSRMQRKPTWNDRFRLDVLRLKDMAVKTLDPLEYTEMAELALLAGFPTEAKKAMDEGYAEGVMGKGNNAGPHKALRDKANKQAADDAKNISAGEASAMKSKDGTGLVNLGYAYVTMDQFDKGIKLMEQGIAKGGLKRADESKLRLAIAYAKAGRKADAVKAFEGLKGNDGLTDLSKYWITYVNGPVGGSATAAPAAAAPAPAPAPAPVK
jgi:tetratricopeptide (TPR) repeat protein